MAWVRIHDGAMTHPKVVGLSDKAFRLWVWGLSYSQQHLTDGAIPAAALPSRTGSVVALLIDARLWDVNSAGFHIHDYLDWNDSRDVVRQKRDSAKTRLQQHRDKKAAQTPQLKRVSSPTSETLLARSGVGSTSTSLEEKEEALTLRAGQLLERYAELFYLHRRGARYHNRMHLDFPKAQELVRTWTDDARLDKLAILVLTTDDDWIARTDRGFGIFAAKASWADDKLRAWELENGVAV